MNDVKPSESSTKHSPMELAGGSRRRRMGKRRNTNKNMIMMNKNKNKNKNKNTKKYRRGKRY